MYVIGGITRNLLRIFMELRFPWFVPSHIVAIQRVVCKISVAAIVYLYNSEFIHLCSSRIFMVFVSLTLCDYCDLFNYFRQGCFTEMFEVSEESQKKIKLPATKPQQNITKGILCAHFWDVLCISMYACICVVLQHIKQIWYWTQLY